MGDCEGEGRWILSNTGVESKGVLYPSAPPIALVCDDVIEEESSPGGWWNRWAVTLMWYVVGVAIWDDWDAFLLSLLLLPLLSLLLLVLSLRSLRLDLALPLLEGKASDGDLCDVMTVNPSELGSVEMVDVS